MAEISDARRFSEATLLQRALLLIDNCFTEPDEAVSRVNVVAGLANAQDAGGRGVIGGTPLSGGSSKITARTSLLVSEPWLLLERAGVICRDLTLEGQRGDWWVLTPTGKAIRDSSDPEGELKLRVSSPI